MLESVNEKNGGEELKQEDKGGIHASGNDIFSN